MISPILPPNFIKLQSSAEFERFDLSLLFLEDYDINYESFTYDNLDSPNDVLPIREWDPEEWDDGLY